MTSRLVCVLAAVVLIATLLPLPAPAQSSGGTAIGLVSKVIPEVSRKESGKEWAAAKRGDPLLSGDKVRTGEKALAVIKFNDNSMIRVRERSEVAITATLSGQTLSKAVDVDNGVIGFNVKKQQAGEEFRFSSPTSVASIRGTGGIFMTGENADTLTLLDGVVLFTNRVSNRSLNVNAGFTGISTRSGNLETHPSTRAEQQAASDALKGENEQPPKQLKLQLKGPNGETRELNIQYKE
jgi:hypothetical protein